MIERLTISYNAFTARLIDCGDWVGSDWDNLMG